MEAPEEAASSHASGFRLDVDELHKFQEEIPRELQILRLRLRFGLPARVRLGQRFRVVVDLVDEMGQPAPKSSALLEGIDISIAFPEPATTIRASPVDDDQVVLKVEEQTASQYLTSQRTKWVYYVSLQSDEDTAVICSDSLIHLSIMPRQTSTASSAANGSRRQLQSFCVGSSWLNDHVLVLPLQVELHLARSKEESQAVTKSTICQRIYRSSLSTTPQETKKCSVLVIEENYGDAMGSHVWDASILMSFAVIQAGITTTTHPQQNVKEKQTTLELGSGCGLLAAVLASQESSDATLATIFTEKAECTERLQTNLDRNGAFATASVLPLEWGAPLPRLLSEANVRTVFAADVLYNWAVHEDFLATLDSLAQNRESSRKIQVVLAHKRRGNASVTRLDALASGASNVASHCGVVADPLSCRWLHWQVVKLCSLGRVDLFILSQTPTG